MTPEPFQPGQIWRRGRYHGLLLSADRSEFLRGEDTIYAVFIFERGDIIDWFESYMVLDIKHKQMELVA